MIGYLPYTMKHTFSLHVFLFLPIFKKSKLHVLLLWCHMIPTQFSQQSYQMTLDVQFTH